ncbi:uncharacterized protein LOC122376084 [Amphibalanus amphitrite]|uniref:uncharacterized protein LOC122376084 n=1 Tax=Amphibalanus amphitrite TaxID=1232801 RepID=UPI001C9247A4|nr:uncharacterized protein LOC122376084 [Amphibalanus amphitrite]
MIYTYIFSINTTLPSVRLEDLWQPYQPARFPTDGVYSPRAPQGWHTANTELPSAALSFPENVNPPPGGTVSDAAAEPDLGTVSNIETVDIWDWSAQQQRRQPPPTATLFESPIDSLRAMEERRRQGQSNYTPQAWSDHSVH